MECKDGVCYLRKSKVDMEKDKVPLPESGSWTIYGAEYCGYCKKAVKKLEKNNIKYTYYDVELYNSVKEELKELTNSQRTIPIIFNGIEFIGGYSELNIYFEKRKHQGINQNTGKLKKGYRYTGKKLKNGLSQIIKAIKK